MEFRSLYRHGFARIAACSLPVAIADPAANAERIAASLDRLSADGVAVAVYPELCVSAYAIDDLRQQEIVLREVLTALAAIARASADLLPLAFVGAPLVEGDRLFNAAVAIHRGRILGVVPKIHLPNHREFYEARHFVSGAGVAGGALQLGGHLVPFGTDLLFSAKDFPDLTVHAEICEDLWMPIPPSSQAALAGASVLVNLSASNITVGKARIRGDLCRSQSARCLAAYAYAAAGAGESSTDLAWDGQTSIFENGVALAESARFPKDEAVAIADVDLAGLRRARLRLPSLDTNRRLHATPFRTVGFPLAPPAADLGLRRRVARFPFVPDDTDRLAEDCYEAYSIQVSALAQRLEAASIARVVIGVSGGLDSTQALLVAARAFDRLGRDRTDILAFTMPGFGTSDATRDNALALMRALCVSTATLDIRPAAERMLADIGHPAATGAAAYDVTYENVQAGLRTDHLFRLANLHGGIVLGTGDLSELALGWCTYGVGDQMSHYNVNSGLPKTLIQHLIRWVIASAQFDDAVGVTLSRILATEISPELVPADASGAGQSTEAVIGPYALQDFHLFHVLRGSAPSTIAWLAEHAWSDRTRGDWPAGIPPELRPQYELSEIRRWLEVFLARFFGSAQFKRSAMPNGPKVSDGGSLSPRGDWRAPSDGRAGPWLDELHHNVPQR